MDANLNIEIEKTFSALELILPEKVLSELANATPDEMYLFHFGLGLYIRNNLLSPYSKLYSEFVNADITHKGDMSALIIRLFHKYLNAK